MNQKMKDKLAQIKNKAKAYAPTVIAFTAAAISIALVVKPINKTICDGSDFKLPEVTGDEKSELFAREDTVVQKVEDGFYFLSIVTKSESE